MVDTRHLHKFPLRKHNNSQIKLRTKISPSKLKNSPKGGLVALLILLFFLSFQSSAQVDLIPKPYQVLKQAGPFKLNARTRIIFDSETKKAALLLQSEIKKDLGLDLDVDGPIGDNFSIDNSIIVGKTEGNQGHEEKYSIQVTSPFVSLYASSNSGLSRGISSLRQLYLFNKNLGVIPAFSIVDEPRFSHRGLLLDCSRHFFSVATVKKYIDLLAFYKMNVLHWHLTEDQGWRIEIDKYPKLTEIGAWRTEKDGSLYGGFYTKQEIREVVAFAATRGVTVIPEIELPGHSQAAIAAYPNLSCTGEQVEVVNDWGVFKEIYCAGNDSVFTFLEDVLTEVMELFPSKYIHIGGDEAPKFRWEHCDKCQKRIADQGLKDEHELQSYFITRIEKFLNANGRELIGWDEILEGGLSPNASVQSWRGMEHGKHAAEMKHNVVMSPTSHCYLDYGLEAINLERVYSFNPIPEGLEKEFEQYILGAEVNMWTEHVPNDSVLDSRVFPRLIAMAEVLWTGPYFREASAKQNQGEYQDFYNRLQSHYPVLENMGVKYGLEAEPITVKTFVRKDKTYVEVIPGLPILTLEYSLGDGLAYPYKKPFLLERSTLLEVMAFKNSDIYGDVFKTDLIHHKALGNQPTYTNTYSSYYPAGGDLGLVDGLIGTLNFRDGRWQGFAGEDLCVKIDLGKPSVVTSLKMNFYEYPNAWIMLPKSVGLQVSTDGKIWQDVEVELIKGEPETHPSEKQIIHSEIAIRYSEPIRYIKVLAENYGSLPAWHEAAGSDAWIFIDEIVVQ